MRKIIKLKIKNERKDGEIEKNGLMRKKGKKSEFWRFEKGGNERIEKEGEIDKIKGMCGDKGRREVIKRKIKFKKVEESKKERCVDEDWIKREG